MAKQAVVVAATVAAVLLRTAVATCPFNCHDRGYCAGLNDEICECWAPWAADATCSRRACPLGPVWQAFPDINGDVHAQEAECSNRGTCDTTSGTCICDHQFAGNACQWLWCENDCSGHGACVPMSQAAREVNYRNLHVEARYETAWDAERVFGCVCDEGWEGHDCSARSCPLGDDPLTTGTYETQVIRTTALHLNEVQLVTIAGATDTDEVQVLELAEGTAGPDPFAGTFTLTFDSRETASFCELCNITVRATTEQLPFNATAADVETALEALENIDSVDVSRSDFAGHNGFIWSITFDGMTVGGNVPELELSSDRVGGDDLIVNLYTDTDGSEITGSLDLSYDDTADDAHPGGTVGPDTVRMAVDVRGRFIAEGIAGLDAIGEVEASRIVSGGPGVQWLITFTEAVGNLTELGCDPTGLSGDASITCTVETVQDGNFLDGNFSVFINSIESDTLAWDVSADDMAANLTALDDTVGYLEVSRTQSFPGGVSADWTGGYEWTVTFRSLPFDYVVMDVDNGTLTGGGDETGVLLGTAENPITGTETNPDGAEVSEVQIVECACPDDCEGTIRFSFRGETTTDISSNATSSEFADALIALKSIHNVIVNYYGSPDDSFCDADGVSTAITFAYDGGDHPPLSLATSSSFFTSASAPNAVAFAMKAGNGQLGIHGGMTKEGTRVMLPCSNRGLCNTDGTCRCFFGFSRTNGAGIEVAGELGEIRNCGYQLRSVRDCPGSCSFHGTCSGAPDYVCTCDEPYDGAACERVKCPTAAAWFDEADVDGNAHAAAPCSNRGVCKQSIDGSSCSCTQPFEGVACHIMGCPGTGVAPGQAGAIEGGCNGHGRCRTLQQLGNFSVAADGSALNGVTYRDWDDTKIKGCVCDKHFYKGPFAQNWVDYTGYDCSELTCPFGDDPKTPFQVSEVQNLTCDASSGTFTLSFRGNTTAPIDASFPAMGYEDSVQAALEGINTIRNVTVSFANDSATVCDPVGVTTSITFVSEHGNVPLLEADASNLVGGTIELNEVTAGNKETFECNRRGKCDRSSGKCVCAPQYGSSNGNAGNGTLGDCGFIHALWSFPFPIPDPDDDITPFD